MIDGKLDGFIGVNELTQRILSFRHNDKHETQHVGQLISIKGHII